MCENIPQKEKEIIHTQNDPNNIMNRNRYIKPYQRNLWIGELHADSRDYKGQTKDGIQKMP